jgi:GNAT superfamily N-acetyltransferase
VDSGRFGSWEKLSREYPQSGPPGISYFRGVREDGYQVNCLLYRDEEGRLIGFLNHFPSDIPLLEERGHGNVMVHPDHRREGIGRKLMLEFLRRGWEGNAQGYRTTPEGAALIRELYEELRPYHQPPET